MEKNIKFLKGPTAKLKPQFDGNFFWKQGKRTFLMI